MSEDNPPVQCKLPRKVQIVDKPHVIPCSVNEKLNPSDSSSRESNSFETDLLDSYRNRSNWNNRTKADYKYFSNKNSFEVNKNKYTDMSRNRSVQPNLYNKFSSRPNSHTDINEDSVLNNSFIHNSQKILANYQKWANREPLQNQQPEMNFDDTSSTDISENNLSTINYNNSAFPEYYVPLEETQHQEQSVSESGSENYVLLPRDYSFRKHLNNIHTAPLNWQQQYFRDNQENSTRSYHQNEYDNYESYGKPIQDTEDYNVKEGIISSSVTTEFYNLPQQQVQNLFKSPLQTNSYDNEDERSALMNLITEYLESQTKEESSSSSSSNESNVVDASIRRHSTLEHDIKLTSRERTGNPTSKPGELDVIAEVSKDEIYSSNCSNFLNESPLKRSKMQNLSFKNETNSSDSSESLKSNENHEIIGGQQFIKPQVAFASKTSKDHDIITGLIDTQKLVDKKTSSIISPGVQNFLDSLKDETPIQTIDFGTQPLMPELKTSCSDENCENRQGPPETCCTNIPIACAGIQGQICTGSQKYANILTLFTFLVLGGIGLVSLKEIYSTCHPSLFLPVTFVSFVLYSAFNAIEAFENVTGNYKEFTPHRTAYMVVMTLAIPFLTADAWMRYMKRCYSQVAYVFPCLCLIPFWFSNNPCEIENALLLINGISLATFTMLCCIFQSFIGTAAVIVFIGSFALVGDLSSTKETQMQSFLNFCHCIFLLFIAMSVSKKH